MLSSIFIVAVAVHHAAASASPALLPRDLSQLIYPSAAATAGGVARIWTGADLDRASSVLNYEQMKPLILRLEAGLPITVLALGDSITAIHGGCFHRDRCMHGAVSPGCVHSAAFLVDGGSGKLIGNA